MIVAHNSHYTQRLHAMLLGVEERWLVENDIWMDIGIQIGNAIGLHGVLERCLAIAGRII